MSDSTYFIEKFDLEKTIKFIESPEQKLRVLRSKRLKSDIAEAMNVSVATSNYVVRHRTDKTADSYFAMGKEKSDIIYLRSDAILLESLLPKELIVALSYSVLWDVSDYKSYNCALPDVFPIDEIRIDFVQSPANVDLNKFKKFQNLINCNPHEFLMAHFIGRLRGVLDIFPDIKVSFDGKYSEIPASKCLNERFLNKKLELNPNKERVRQILGPENTWVKYRS